MPAFSKDNALTVIALLAADLEGRTDDFMAVMNGIKDEEHQGIDQAMFYILAQLAKRDVARRNMPLEGWIAELRRYTLEDPGLG
jgi:hypothetical protein